MDLRYVFNNKSLKTNHLVSSYLHEPQSEPLVEVLGGAEVPGHGEGGLGQHLAVLAHAVLAAVPVPVLGLGSLVTLQPGRPATWI